MNEYQPKPIDTTGVFLPEELMRLFRSFCREHGLLSTPDDCFSYLHAFPDRYEQMDLFSAAPEKDC